VRDDKNEEKKAPGSASLFIWLFLAGLEVTLAHVVAAIAINFQRFAGAFTRRAAVFAVRLRGTGTNRILTLFLVVCHASLLKSKFV
jgi:hypothetical protein